MNIESGQILTSYSAVVGGILANMRKQHGLKQSEICTRLNISQATWSRIERGASPINVSQLSEIAKLFNSTPNRILNQADKMVEELKGRGVSVSHYPEKNKEAMMILGTAALIGLAAILFGSE